MTTSAKSTHFKAPNLRFLLQHPAHFLALGFGSGLAPKAPGTAGTLVALPLTWLMLMAKLSMPTQLMLIGMLFIVGIKICSITGKNLGAADHGSIVWDEIVAMMLVLTFTPPSWLWWLTAFLLFRLFDIWKPFPIRQCDAALKNGFGVMFDDLLAAIYAILLLAIMQWR